MIEARIDMDECWAFWPVTDPTIRKPATIRIPVELVTEYTRVQQQYRELQGKMEQLYRVQEGLDPWPETPVPEHERINRMKYPHNMNPNLLTVITYGSHLYGTNGPSSDFDFKGIVLPDYRDLILAKQPRTTRERYTADGVPVKDDENMPANGWESELTPVQKFVHDFLGGQAYAVELAFAVIQGAHTVHAPAFGTPERRRWMRFSELCEALVTDYRHKNVQGMVGFAMKQTFDYVRRGERYNAACAVLEAVDAIEKKAKETGFSLFHTMRLDAVWTAPSHTILDELVARTGLEVGTTMNHDKAMRTLKLNGREYLETTALSHFKGAVEKLVDQYGERSTKAAETDVDWKSLSHAVRVYQQVIEYLQTGHITFPRPNADALKAIRMGQAPLSMVKELLRELDDQVQELTLKSTQPTADELRESADDLLCDWLHGEYNSLRANLNV